jgi:para-nitrobenzyl esterase
MTHLAHRFSRRVRIGALCIAAALAITLTASVTSVAAAPSKQSSFTPVEQLVASPGRLTSQSLTVTTDDGQLHGRTTGPVDQWLGIPYARPPVGALRWEPPQPAASWTGVRDAVTYGNECTQLGNPTVNSEDCLYLNVFAPAVVKAGAKLPVLFWIHGGGSVSGSGDQYDGSLLAQSDGIIVVTINYRLGPFGILDLPGLSSAEPAGNFSLLDMEAALRWTQSNIAAFDGDPSKVTIAGESAGGMAVCSLLASPPAKGLFSAAIMESGSCRGNSEATAQAEALAVAKAAGCPDAATAAACMRGKSEERVLSASASFIPVWYTYGGPDLPISPLQAIESGQYNRVPVLMGDNRDEGRAFSAGYAGYTSQQYTQLVNSAFGAGCGAVFGLNGFLCGYPPGAGSSPAGLASQVLARYPFSAFPKQDTGSYAIGALITDSWLYGGIGGCGAQEVATSLAKTTTLYFYQFDDPSPPSSSGGLPGFQPGPDHGSELPFLWPSVGSGNSLAAEFTPAEQELSSQMVTYWGKFTKTGSPDTSGQPGWPTYSASAGSHAMLISLRPGDQTRTISGATYSAEHQCSFWDEHAAITGSRG